MLRDLHLVSRRALVSFLDEVAPAQALQPPLCDKRHFHCHILDVLLLGEEVEGEIVVFLRFIGRQERRVHVVGHALLKIQRLHSVFHSIEHTLAHLVVEGGLIFGQLRYLLGVLKKLLHQAVIRAEILRVLLYPRFQMREYPRPPRGVNLRVRSLEQEVQHIVWCAVVWKGEEEVFRQPRRGHLDEPIDEICARQSDNRDQLLQADVDPFLILKNPPRYRQRARVPCDAVLDE
mmetsp:Transcript_32529/g.45351  ORF Transcript_32529/g.45351 Transcript_32529/m.45351 type:complete len:233 (-) Transcript_32529:486-1184(-)